ncbi:hypothetical protein ATO6_14875 [Oceanicola sp. 22II-s10i]|uniref:NADH:flavin oxidoreductase/NADH oxidase n=1 Tax=Oceanicola sp. 22II-s10i TaxID=1317116 RepID=UPI000B523150|nr:NADH:flavin oxidoreductase/NADH oxidase [Oceanicola sp. 22II-s10i]OWU84300.1 hypothetical protein ATO6_14875 [Oceanicola sp. 22II-s10i]
MSKLFTPIDLRGVRLRNRIVIPPMHQYAADDGHVSDWTMMNAGRFAAGGPGLFFVESTKVERRGAGTVGDLGLWDDKFVPGMTRLASFIRRCGAVPGIQLGHSGRKAKRFRPWEGGHALTGPEAEDPTWRIVGPSAIAQGNGYETPEAPDTEGVRQMVANWVAAAVRARDAGFDVLEIHGAHGYLVNQFLSDVANQRTDEYGGSFENRTRFLCEIVEGVRGIWPDDKPLFVRLSVEDHANWTVEDSIALSKRLKELGVDVVDCSSGGIGRTQGGPPLEVGYQVPYASALKREAGIMTMAVGLIFDPEHAEEILQTGDADLIAVGRGVQNEPNWPFHAAVALGEEAPFDLLPDQQKYWLANRAKRGWR